MVRRRATVAVATDAPSTVAMPTEAVSEVGSPDPVMAPEGARPDPVTSSPTSDNTPSPTALKVELEQAHQRELLLHRQISTLQTELETLRALPAKLVQAEDTIRQLALANAKLTQTLDDLQTANAQRVSAQTVHPPTAKKQAAIPQSTRSLQPAAQAASPSAPVVDAHTALMQQQRNMLAHPIFPDKKLPGQMSDQDLDWFD
jgi:hypothetical protein